MGATYQGAANWVFCPDWVTISDVVLRVKLVNDCAFDSNCSSLVDNPSNLIRKE